MTQASPIRLQTTYVVVPGSAEEQVLNFLLDRGRTTSTAAKQKILQALVPWHHVDSLRSQRDSVSEAQYRAALLGSLAALKSRVAYIEALLEQDGASLALRDGGEGRRQATALRESQSPPQEEGAQLKTDGTEEFEDFF